MIVVVEYSFNVHSFYFDRLVVVMLVVMLVALGKLRVWL